MTRTPILALAAALAVALAAPALAAPAASSCKVQLKTSEEARALVQVKLDEEMERADAQTYLTRLELADTKRKLAAALAKCGAACAPPAAPTPPVPK